jgi:hypothetical protein
MRVAVLAPPESREEHASRCAPRPASDVFAIARSSKFVRSQLTTRMRCAQCSSRSWCPVNSLVANTCDKSFHRELVMVEHSSERRGESYRSGVNVSEMRVTRESTDSPLQCQPPAQSENFRPHELSNDTTGTELRSSRQWRIRQFSVSDVMCLCLLAEPAFWAPCVAKSGNPGATARTLVLLANQRELLRRREGLVRPDHLRTLCALHDHANDYPPDQGPQAKFFRCTRDASAEMVGGCGAQSGRGAEETRTSQ